MRAEFDSIQAGFSGVEDEIDDLTADVNLKEYKTEVALKAYHTGDTYTGTHDFKTATVEVANPTSAAQAVTKLYADNLVFTNVLPDQAGNNGRTIITDGEFAFWSDIHRASIYRETRTGNTVIGYADHEKFISITSGTFNQTFAASSVLTDGWACWYENAGTGTVTLVPNGSETIQGKASRPVYPGEVLIVYSDGANLFIVVLKAGVFWDALSGTWVKPSGYTKFAFYLTSGGDGGGGGGGGGAGEYSGSAPEGGQGGQGGSPGRAGRTLFAVRNAADLPDSVTYVIGSGGDKGTGGAGGAGAAVAGLGSSGSDGTSGTVGGATIFGTDVNALYYLSTGTNASITNKGGGGSRGNGSPAVSQPAAAPAAITATAAAWGARGIDAVSIATGCAIGTAGAASANAANGTEGSDGIDGTAPAMYTLVVSTGGAGGAEQSTDGADGNNGADASGTISYGGGGAGGGAGGGGGSGSKAYNGPTGKGGDGGDGSDGWGGYIQIMGII